MSFRLADLASHVGAEIVGDPERRIEALRSLESAGPTDLSFLSDVKNRELAERSTAGAIVVPREAEGLQKDLLIIDDPEWAMAQLLDLVHPPELPVPGIHSSAVVGDGCSIADSAHVGPFAVIGDECEIGDRSVVHGHVHLGPRVRLGSGVVLYPQVSVYRGTQIGNDVVVHSGAVLGADGHGYLRRDGAYRKVPQVGHVVVEDEVEIGANSAVDRATLEVTRIGRGTKIDNLVQVGHNVELGEDGMLCALSGVAGSTRVGSSVVMAGQSGIADHLKVGDGVTIGAQSAVLRDVEAGRVVGGTPAIDYSKWRRQFVMLGRLEEMNRRIRELEDSLRAREERQP